MMRPLRQFAINSASPTKPTDDDDTARVEFIPNITHTVEDPQGTITHRSNGKPAGCTKIKQDLSTAHRNTKAKVRDLQSGCTSLSTSTTVHQLQREKVLANEFLPGEAEPN